MEQTAARGLLGLLLCVSLALAPAWAARAKTDFVVANSAEPATLDPSAATSAAERRLALALFEGLVVPDAKTGDAAPGLAVSWKHDKDRLVWTFQLRTAAWSDGTPITASTVVGSWQRQIGAVASWVDPAGLKADGKTLEVRFLKPLPSVSVLLQPGFAIVPVHVLDTWGAEWWRPGHMVSNGPFALDQWVPHDRLVMVPSPSYWDRKAVRLTRLTFLAAEDTDLAWGAYQRGEADWLPDVPAARWDSASTRRDAHHDPVATLYSLALNTADPALADVRVRRALSLAVDRASLVASVTRGGELAFSGLAPAFGGFRPVAPVSDLKAARKLLADAGFPAGQGFPGLTILIPVGETHRKIAEAVAAQWGSKLGLVADVKALSWEGYVADRQAGRYQAARSVWSADYADPLTFLDLWAGASPAYDQALARVRGLDAGAERTKALATAETLLLAEQPTVPLFQYATRQLIDTTKWDGWYANPLDVHPWKALGPKK